MIITQASHLDHGLTDAHRAFLFAKFGDRTAFFLETIELPPDLTPLNCGLHGPIMGDAPVLDAECFMMTRSKRLGESRVCRRSPRRVQTVTVIGGPHELEPCILYTAFGGPSAPREPWDPSLDATGQLESIAFWAVHALSMVM